MNTIASVTRTMPLYKLLDELLTSYGKINHQRSALLTNAIPRHIHIASTHHSLAPLMGDWFSILSTNPEHLRLRISARTIDSNIHLYATQD